MIVLGQEIRTKLWTFYTLFEYDIFSTLALAQCPDLTLLGLNLFLAVSPHLQVFQTDGLADSPLRYCYQAVLTPPFCLLI